MLLLKFRFYVTLLFLSSTAFSYSTLECLNSSYDVSISHKVYPFGLFDRILKIKKNNCIIDIYREDLKFMRAAIQVDVCRGPIHIKSGLQSVDVVKKDGRCLSEDKQEFCQMSRTFLQYIQDDGLIFASGVKENLNDDHGKTYCSFYLLKKYLQDDIEFSPSDKNLENEGPFMQNKNEASF